MPSPLDSDDVVHDVGHGVVDGDLRDCFARTASRAPLLKGVLGDRQERVAPAQWRVV
jgi:hypothetical protein